MCWLCGCSRLVDPDGLEVRCEVGEGEPDPCAAIDMRCGAAGVCETCDESVDERCDGLDNNCNGEIDEGHDEDGDGFSWCGGGVEALRDCIDEDPDIHPPNMGADGEAEVLEVCDGKDNDCNGVVDDSDDCAVSDCVKDGCVAALVCDEESRKCVAPRPEGSACGANVECDGGFCVDTGLLNLPGGGSGRVCATACCTDDDCSGSDVCVVSGMGLRACLPTRIAGKEPAGSGCSDDEQCSSNICIAGQCIATCGNADDCPLSCVVNRGSLSGSDTVWACGVNPLGRGDDGDSCYAADPTACKSGLCLDMVCRSPCRTSEDCASGGACDVISAGRSRLAACVSGGSSVRVCCTNDDCGNDGVCRPVGSSDSWSMSCD